MPALVQTREPTSSIDLDPVVLFGAQGRAVVRQSADDLLRRLSNAVGTTGGKHEVRTDLIRPEGHDAIRVDKNRFRLPAFEDAGQFDGPHHAAPPASGQSTDQWSVLPQKMQSGFVEFALEVASVMALPLLNWHPFAWVPLLFSVSRTEDGCGVPGWQPHTGRNLNEHWSQKHPRLTNVGNTLSSQP